MLVQISQSKAQTFDPYILKLLIPSDSFSWFEVKRVSKRIDRILVDFEGVYTIVVSLYT